MPWTVIQPTNGKPCSKRFVRNRDSTDFSMQQFSLLRLIEDEDLTKEVIAEELQALRDGHGIVMKTRPHPEIANTGSFARTPEVFEDSTTNLVIWDVDCFAPIDIKDWDAPARRQLLLEELPILQGVGMVVQLSASAGLGTVHKGKKAHDYTKRVSMRVYMLANEALTHAEWNELMEPIARIPKDSGFTDNDNHYFDMRLFSNRVLPVWVGDPVDIDTTRSPIDFSDIHLFDGDLLRVDEVKALSNVKLATVSKKIKTSSTGGDGSFDTDVDRFVWSLQYDQMLETLNALELDGQSVRNDLLVSIYRRTALHSITDLGATTQKILDIYRNLWQDHWQGDRETAKRNLEARQKRAERWSARIHLGENEFLRPLLCNKVQTIDQRELTRELFEICYDGHSIFNIDCGGNKTEVLRVAKEYLDSIDGTGYFISPYRVVAAGNQVDDGVVYYDWYRQGSLGKGKVAAEEQVSSWVHKSLAHIPPENREGDVLIVDEFVDVLLDFGSNEDLEAHHNAFKQLVRGHDKVIWLDADYNDEYALRAVSLYSGEGNQVSTLYQGTVSYSKGMDYYLVDGGDTALFLAINAINDGERVLINLDVANISTITNKVTGAIDSVVSLINEQCPGKNVVGYDSNNAPHDLIRDYGNYIESLVDSGLDCLVLSPLAPKGASYLPKDTSKDFDLDVSIFTQRFTNARKAYQTTRRNRRTTQHIVSMPKRKDFDADTRFYEYLKDKGLLDTAIDWKTDWGMLADVEQMRRASNPFDHLWSILWQKEANFYFMDFSEKCGGDLAYLKKRYAHWKKVHKGEDITDRELLLRCLSSWRIIKDGVWQGLKPDDVSTEGLKRYSKRYKNIKSDSVQAMLETLTQTPNERQVWNDSNPAYKKQFRIQVGAIFDSIVSTIDPHCNDHLGLFDWYVKPTDEAIHINLDEVNTTELMYLVRNNYKLLRQIPVKPHKNVLDNPAYAIKWLCEILDLDVSITGEEDAVMRREAAIKEKQVDVPGRYHRSLTMKASLVKLLQDIEGKRKIGLPLTKVESAWYATRNGVITIRKQVKVSWLIITLLSDYLNDAECRSSSLQDFSKIIDTISPNLNNFGKVLESSYDF